MRLRVSLQADSDNALSCHCQIGQDLADQARELEAVAAARAGDDDVGAAGEEIDDELLVGGDRVEADLGQIDRRMARSRDVSRRKPRTMSRYSSPTVRSSMSGSISGPLCRATLTPRPVNTRHPVEGVAWLCPHVDEDREPADLERSVVSGAEIEHLLARGLERNGELGQETLDPVAGTDDQPVSDDPPRVGHDDGAVSVEVDPPDRGGRHDLRLLAAAHPGQIDLERDGPCCREHSRVGLEDCVVVGGNQKAGFARFHSRPSFFGEERRCPPGWMQPGPRSRRPRGTTRRRRYARKAAGPRRPPAPSRPGTPRASTVHSRDRHRNGG